MCDSGFKLGHRLTTTQNYDVPRLAITQRAECYSVLPVD